MKNKTVFQGLSTLLAPLSIYAMPANSGQYISGQHSRSYLAALRPESARPLTPPPLRTARSTTAESNSDELVLQPGMAARELVLVAPGVPQREWFRFAGAPGIDLVFLKNSRQPQQALIRLLGHYHNLSAIHLISHGEPGALWLGQSKVDVHSLKSDPDFLQAFNQATRKGADLLLYGCDIAAENAELLDIIQANTHLDIAASDDKTGAAELGGDWELEIQRGSIETGSPFSPLALKDFTALLGPTPGTTVTISSSATCYDRGNFSAGSTYAYGGLNFYVGTDKNDASTYIDCTNLNAMAMLVYNDGTGTESFTINSDDGTNFTATAITLAGYASTSMTLKAYKDSVYIGSQSLTGLPDAQGSVANNYVTKTLSSAFSGIDEIHLIPPSGLYTGFKFKSLAIGSASNSAPTNISLTSTNINQSNAVLNGVVGTLSTTDADSGDSHTYSLVSNGASGSGSCGSAGDDNNASFQIDNVNDELEAAASLNAGSYNVCIQTDDGTATYQKSFAITVTDNVAPSFENSTPSVSSTGLYGATLNGDLTEEGSVYYVVVADGDTAPSVTQVKSGQNASGSAALASGSFTTSVTTGSDAFTGLSYATAYDLYVVAQDDEVTPNVQSSTTLVNFTTSSPDADGSLMAAAGIAEPVSLTTTTLTSATATAIFDFTLRDGGSGDGLAMNVSQIRLNSSGTLDAGKVTLLLNGADAVNAAATYSANTFTFSGLSVSVADGASETYTVSAYYNDATGLTEGQTLVLSVDGDTDITIASGSSMGTTTAVANGTGSAVSVAATTLSFSTQPAGSVSGSALTSQPVVSATDSSGNTDTDFTGTITLTEASAGTLSGTTSLAATAGVAAFSAVTYSATADQQSFTLTAASDGLTSAAANAVTADVVATTLSFSTQPAPLTISNATPSALTTVPVVHAVDSDGITDTGYSTGIMLAEVNGAGSATMTASGDTDGNAATVTITPSAGAATFTAMSLTYTASGSSDETFNLQASSGGLSSVNSSQITATTTPVISAADITLSGASGTGGTFITGDTITATWDNTASGGNNAGVTSVTVDFSAFGGGSSVAASNSSESWTATYTVTSGSIDADNLNIAVTATNSSGSSTTTGTDNASLDNEAVTVTDAALSVNSGSGSGGAFISGDTVTLSWDNTASGDNNSDTIAGVSADFSALGGGSAVAASNNAGIWSASYTITTGTTDSGGLNLSLTATDNAGNSTTTADSSNLTVDNQPPVVTDAHLSIAGASGNGGVFIAGDTITASWDNSAGGDNNSDITTATVDFSAFGGGAVIAATDNGAGLWTASYTLPAGTLEAANLNISLTATDNAGSSTTTADSGNASADNRLPAGHSAAFDSSLLNSTDAASASFTFTAAETGAGYSYSISSSGGGSAVTGSGTLVTAGDQITGIDLSGLADGSLTLSVVLTDPAGNSATAVTASATLDQTEPVLNSSSPEDGATGVSYGADIVLTLSESVTAGSGSFHLYDTNDNTFTDDIAVGSSQVSISGSQVTITPSSPWTTAHSYYVLADSGILTDSAGNPWAGLSANTELNFTIFDNASIGTADSADTDEDTAVSINVLANDASAGSGLNPASVRVTAPPAHGSAQVDTGSGAITYTPDANYHGSDSLSYTVDDISLGTSAAISVAITINAVNDAPQAMADVVSVAEDGVLNADVAANDTDPDSGDSVDSSTLTIVTQPLHGSASVIAGMIRYSPDTGYRGPDSLTYQIDDQQGATSEVAGVLINVGSINTAPLASDDSGSTDEDTAVVLTVLSNDSDADGVLDISSVSVLNAPAHGSATTDSSNGEITYTPAADYDGNDSFTYVVRDDAGAVSDPATVTLTINPVNDAPVAVADTATLPGSTAISINVLGNDSDADGSPDPASLDLVDPPADGSASVADGMIRYTPGGSFSNSDSLTYRVQDNDGAWSDPATVTITSQPVNDQPLANNDSVSTGEDTLLRIDVAANDDDVDGSLNLASIEIGSGPSHGSLTDHSDGTLTYTPAANYYGADSFTYRIADNEATPSAWATVSIRISAVNDAPVISGTPAASVLEGQTFSFTPSASDVENSRLTFSLSGQPDWLSIDAATGTVTGIPQQGDAGSYAGILIRVSDGSDSTSLNAFTLTVAADNDGDGIADVDDPDDDNDGMPDSYENTYGFDPFDPADGALDADGDHVSNAQEAADNTDPTDSTDYADSTPPVITPPADITLDAGSLFTQVSLARLLGLNEGDDTATALAALTTDNIDGAGCCNTAVSGMTDGVLHLRPGLHAVTYTANDNKGNSASASQTVRIRPLVSFSRDITSVEGADIRLKVVLNGLAPDYPLEVPYVIDASSSAGAADHNLTAGSVIFSAGEVAAEVSFSLTDDGMSEGEEQLLISLDDHTSDAEDLSGGYDPATPDIYDINAGAHSTLTVSILDAGTNIPPIISMSLQQSGSNTLLVTPSGGTVTAAVSVADPNPGDSQTYDWSGTDSTLIDTDGDLSNGMLTFSPAGLSAGQYQLHVTVTDSAGATDSSRIYFRVADNLPVLDSATDSDEDGIDDQTEGFGDGDGDGVPDYLDAYNEANLLPEVAGQGGAYLTECDPDLYCRLGWFSSAGSTGGVRLLDSDLQNQNGISADPTFTPVGGIFDFEVFDLPQSGATARIVLPLSATIPENAVYRKFRHGSWSDFVTDSRNSIHSSAGAAGYCPTPDDSSWTPGLNVGHYCIRLTLEDGGPNDGDGVANRVIADPGAVSVQASIPPDHMDLRSKRRGGASAWWFIAGLTLIALSRRRKAALRSHDHDI